MNTHKNRAFEEISIKREKGKQNKGLKVIRNVAFKK
jgi:hypothetical protein